MQICSTWHFLRMVWIFVGIQQHQHRTASTNSLPSIPHTNVAPNSFFNNQNGSTNVRHRAPAPPPHNNQPPARPPPPHWQQHQDIPQTNLPASNSSSDVISSGMPPKQPSADAVAGLSTAVGQMTVGGGRKSNEDESNEECVVCMTNRVDCVLYTCGHMCMCYACAVQTWQRHSYCPVCRQSIKDVIKAYKSSWSYEMRIKTDFSVFSVRKFFVSVVFLCNIYWFYIYTRSLC